MKKIEYLQLEVIQSGIPSCDKQTIEIFHTGLVKQTLSPMVYFGQAKVYEYEIDEKDIEEFFSTIDISSWNVEKQINALNASWTCFIRYSDETTIKDSGFRTPNMGEGYVNFDEKLLELVPFIERPWLFSL